MVIRSSTRNDGKSAGDGESGTTRLPRSSDVPVTKDPERFVKALSSPEIQAVAGDAPLALVLSPEIVLDEISFADGTDVLRVLYSVFRAKDSPGRLSELVTRFIISHLGDAPETRRLAELIASIGRLLSERLGLLRHPVHILGATWKERRPVETKLYWRVAECDESIDEGSWSMYETDENRAWKAVEGAMETLGLEKSAPKAEAVLRRMYASSFGLELIGVDLGKDREPELKLYFQPLGDSEKAPDGKTSPNA
jgi:hypothetical protein